MSSTFLTMVKSHLSDFKGNLDTLSEPSECGTGSSINSAEELQKIALILGINNVEDIYQERFRVDRRKLEKMLADNLEESQTAHAFFQRVMNDSNTVIKWPTRLKIGARSKKDPHVRVAGLKENVKLAQDKIMQVLVNRANRVTMRIDVSYTDHSHIIGKSGLTIKRVMEETGCHIHFPDSNRTSTVEKSNQVSIAGDIERVERARARVRALTPLIFSFELPVFTAAQPLPDINSIYVLQIQEKYNVQVMLRNRPKLHSNLLVVKGVQWEVQGTMEATNLLMEYMCGPLASQTQVHMNLEISPMHHGVVLGHNSEQLKLILKGTNTQIMFPDAEDPNIPAIRKCSVTITGQIKDVYAARQQLVGSLPLVVIFDMPDECLRIDNESLNRLMNKHNVYVNIRRKPKQGIASVVIKGIERCAGDIYEARRELVGGNEPVITAEIPETYNIPSINSSMPNFNFNPFSPTQGSMNNSPHTPLNNPYVDLNAFNMANLSPYNPPTPGGYSSPMSPPAFPMWAPSLFPSVQVPNPNIYGKQHPWNPMFNQDDQMMGRPTITVSHYPSRPMEHHRAMPTLCRIFNSSSQASSGYQSNFMGSTNSIDTHNTSIGEVSAVASPSVSPISKSQSCTSSNEVDRSQNDLVNLMTELPISDRRAVGCEKKTLETLNKMSPVSDYRSLKAEADKAMREPVGNGYRVPTSRWSGHFFSQTSPAPISLQDDNHNVTPEKQWNRSTLIRPNVLTESPQKNKQCRYTQLYNLLNDLGLSKYIALFQKHEVDLSTFASLSEADLSEIGVMAFGARRKMLLVIEELQKQNSGFKRTPTQGHQGPTQKLIQSPQYNTEAVAEQDKW